MVGGKLTEPGQHLGGDIQGGQVHKLSKGDVIVIPAGTPHWFKEVPHSISYYVVKVLDRVAPDMSGLAAERDKLLKEVLAQKQSLAWESWLNGARANAKIETHLPGKATS